MVKIEVRLDRLRKKLPRSHSLTELLKQSKKAHKWKLTFRLIATKSAIEWRVVDFLSQAIHLYKSDSILAAIVLARSSMETVCLLSYINRIIGDVVKCRMSFPDFQRITERVFAGSKVEEELPDPINVMTTIEKSDKKHPGILESYNNLCEAAHPNLFGVINGYAILEDQLKVATYGFSWDKSHKQQAKVALNLCMDVFEGELKTWQNRFRDLEKWIVKNNFKLTRQLAKKKKEKNPSNSSLSNDHLPNVNTHH